ncbi:hypothetical protein GN958_ATG14719 [Phytophthora infestans]|uniref:Uncharacterized protein n=1 Tax=Phytophthora infestans TaxID=4787 RepID=A0A8S9U765_PHYIN|nr:hypothetical protein GN958_ATG14719 [Phytophthora infestans]
MYTAHVTGGFGECRRHALRFEVRTLFEEETATSRSRSGSVMVKQMEACMDLVTKMWSGGTLQHWYAFCEPIFVTSYFLKQTGAFGLAEDAHASSLAAGAGRVHHPINSPSLFDIVMTESARGYRHNYMCTGCKICSTNAGAASLAVNPVDVNRKTESQSNSKTSLLESTPCELGAHFSPGRTSSQMEVSSNLVSEI